MPWPGLHRGQHLLPGSHMLHWMEPLFPLGSRAHPPVDPLSQASQVKGEVWVSAAGERLQQVL